MVGMSLNRWTQLNGNQVYQNVIRGLLQPPSKFGFTQVTDVTSMGRWMEAEEEQEQELGAHRALQNTGSTLVTATITGNLLLRSQALAALKQSNMLGVSVITSQLRLVSADWASLQSQPVIAVGTDPTPMPTRVPTPMPTTSSAALASLNAQNGNIGGLPTNTLIAIIVVLVLVVLAAAYVACRTLNGSKSVKSVVVDPYGTYQRNSGGSFQSVSPVHRRPSFGSPQNHQSPHGNQPRRHSRGNAVEMIDTYGVSADHGGRPSHEANPGFGSLRISQGRSSIGGGGRASFSAEGRRSSFEGMAPRQPGGTRL